MLGIEELAALEEVLLAEFADKSTEILTRLNRNGDLEAFLEMMGMKHLLAEKSEYEVFKNAKIVVIGQTSVSADKITLAAKKLGISARRLELHLEYEDAKTINAEKYRYDPNYSAILFGPVPHSGISKGEYNSIISTVEQTPGYPPSRRLGGGKLKLTKSDFSEALRSLINDEVIVTDYIV